MHKICLPKGLLSERADLRPDRADLRPDRADLRPERADFRPERADFRPERKDSRPERADFKSERVDFRPERFSGLRGPRGMNGKMDELMNGQTDKRTNKRKSPCVLQGFAAFGAAVQKKASHG